MNDMDPVPRRKRKDEFDPMPLFGKDL